MIKLLNLNYIRLFSLIPLFLTSIVLVPAFGNVHPENDSDLECGDGMIQLYDAIDKIYRCASPFAEYESFVPDDSKTECRDGLVLVYHNAKRDYICTSETTAQKWASYGIAQYDISKEIVSEEETMQETPADVEGDLDLAVAIGFENGRTAVDVEFKLDTLKWNEIISEISQVTSISESDIREAAILKEKTEDQTISDELEESIFSKVPIPDSAKGPEIDPEKGYLVEEIGDGLYWLTDGIYQTMFLTTGEGVIVIDAPPSIGTNYLKAISEVTDERVTHVIYTHTHIDHIGFSHIFPLDAEVIAHEETASQLEKRQDPHRPIPTITFEDSYTLQVGNQILELDYFGPIHEPGNIFIYAPKQKVLMLVDVVFPGWVPFKNLALAEDVPAFVDAHDLILDYEFETFIGGHLTRLGTYEDVKIQQEYVFDLQTNGEIAHETVNFFEIAQSTGFENPWLLIDTYMDSVSQTCTALTILDWQDRLGGADIFTGDHCFSITQSQRID